jgi:hypothetical protein
MAFNAIIILLNSIEGIMEKKDNKILCEFNDLKNMCKYLQGRNSVCEFNRKSEECNECDCPLIKRQYVSCYNCKYLNANSIPSCVKLEICINTHYKKCDEFVDKYDKSHEKPNDICSIELIIDDVESTIVKVQDIKKGDKFKVIQPWNEYRKDKNGNDTYIAKGHSYFSMKHNNWVVPIEDNSIIEDK